MTTLFCIRPATRNIGNDVIATATAALLYDAFGPDASIVNVPALKGDYGGLTAAQVHDMNRLADGVVIGGGNLFENGQLTIDRQALRALQAPLLLIGLSHGRIYDRAGRLANRTDSLPDDLILQLVGKASACLVRDHASKAMLETMGANGVEVGGCPSLFLPESKPAQAVGRRVLLSIRNPSRMSVPPPLQWRTADDVRRLIAALDSLGGDGVHLVCHDYRDLDFAAAFPGTPQLYFDDVTLYMEALRACRLNVTYRLHAFLPCLAFGSPSIHLSYDERGRSSVAAAGMAAWDVDLLRETDVVAAVQARVGELDRFRRLRAEAAGAIGRMREVTSRALRRFAHAIEEQR